MIKIAKIYSTVFLIGFVKWIPGTIGSGVAIIAILPLIKNFNLILNIFLFILILLLSLIFIEVYSKSVKKNDAKEIIVDEFLGIYLIMLFYPYLNSLNDIIKIILIFLLFRFFDIIKPFPANWIDNNFKNSFGVIFDDLIASVFTIFTLFIINAFI